MLPAHINPRIHKTLSQERRRPILSSRRKVNYPAFSWAFSFVVVAVFTLFVIMYLTQCTRIAKSRYHIKELTAIKRSLITEIKEHEVKIEELSKYSRIEWKAQHEFGMSLPKEIISLNIGKELKLVSKDKSFGSNGRGY